MVLSTHELNYVTSNVQEHLGYLRKYGRIMKEIRVIWAVLRFLT